MQTGLNGFQMNIAGHLGMEDTEMTLGWPPS